MNGLQLSIVRMNLKRNINQSANALLHVFFPHICEGCGSDVLNENNILCSRCFSSLDETKFESIPNNPIEKIFIGRLKIEEATSLIYFAKQSVIQRLIHQLKYKHNKEVGLFLGKLLGTRILHSPRFKNIDYLIPIPLHPKKEKLRGYNQSHLICKGMQEGLKIPIDTNVLRRTENTDSQTKKTRIQRWKSMEGKFLLQNYHHLKNKNILLIDDVITTGNTFESCGNALLSIEGLKISIASVCYAKD